MVEERKERKLAFYEIGGFEAEPGKQHLPLLIEVQSTFEEIQRVADKTGRNAKLTLTIEVIPRKNLSDPYGEINFEVKKTLPGIKSANYTTKLNNDGMVLATGESEIDIDQLKLDFKVQKVYKLSNANKEE